MPSSPWKQKVYSSLKVTGMVLLVTDRLASLVGKVADYL